MSYLPLCFVIFWVPFIAFCIYVQAGLEQTDKNKCPFQDVMKRERVSIVLLREKTSKFNFLENYPSGQSLSSQELSPFVKKMMVQDIDTFLLDRYINMIPCKACICKRSYLSVTLASREILTLLTILFLLK